MSEAEESADKPVDDSDGLSAIQRRAEELERRIKEALARRGSGADNAAFGTPAEETTSEDTSSRAEEESTGVALAAVELRQRQLKLRQRKQDMKLRRKLANHALWLVIAQVGVANILFAFYLGHNAYDADPSVMIAWLSATVVEVVGILWVIARNLFPYRDKSAPRPGKDVGHSG